MSLKSSWCGSDITGVSVRCDCFHQRQRGDEQRNGSIRRRVPIVVPRPTWMINCGARNITKTAQSVRVIASSIILPVVCLCQRLTSNEYLLLQHFTVSISRTTVNKDKRPP